MNIHVRTDVDRGEEGEVQAAAPTVSRAGLLSRLAAGLGAVSLGGAAAAGLATATGAQSSSSRDRAVLQFALTLEQLQATFYAEALRAGKLSGEPRQFAQTVGAEEQAHVGYLSQAIGPGALKAQQFRFGEALSDQASFIATAVTLEETGLAAYNGQAANLSPDALARVGRVISVEARHAAWARALAGEQPAPVAIDVPISASQAQKALRRFTA
jgi:rubrerythrin